jgi:hypothetical protein
MESSIPTNLLPQTPLGKNEILSPVKSTEASVVTSERKTKKGKTKLTSVQNTSFASTAPPSNLLHTSKPPINVDDLIKSIQIPTQNITFPKEPIDQNKPMTNKANSPTKSKKNTGEVVKRQCVFCDNIMPKKGLKNHIISAHFKEKLLAKIPSCGPGKTGPYQCPKCEKTLKFRCAH